MLQLRINELEKRVAELEYQVARQQEDMQTMYNNMTHFTQNSIDYFNSANQTMQIHTKMINDLTELKKMDVDRPKPKKVFSSNFAIMIIGGVWILWILISMMQQ